QSNSKHYAWSIQGLLTIPIWDGGSRYGEARVARANVAESKEKLEIAKRGATLEARQAARSVEVADETRKIAEQSNALAKETARLAQVAFDAGSTTSFELVDAAQRQRQAELNLAVKEFDLVKARITALLASSGCTY